MAPTPSHRPLKSTSTAPHALADAFQLRLPGELVAFVGGGGKTSLLFALGRELAAAGKRVVATTTTHMATAEVKGAPAYCLLQDLAQLGQQLDRTRFCLVVGGLGPEKAQSVPPTLPARLLSRDDVDAVLVEADGARQLPVKAPAAHEPLIPPQTTLLVPVVGIDALSAPLQDVAHRPRLVAALTGRRPEETLSPHDVATLLTHRRGGLKSAPSRARVVPFINKVETEEQLAQAAQIARQVAAHARIDRVLIGAAKRDTPPIIFPAPPATSRSNLRSKDQDQNRQP